jgi:hypothetical protein
MPLRKRLPYINNNVAVKRWYAVIKPYWGFCPLLQWQAPGGEFANSFVRPHIHHSKLQEITALSLTSTLHKSLHTKSSSVCSAFTSRTLATDFNSGDSSASHTQILSSQPPMQNSTLNWQLLPRFHYIKHTDYCHEPKTPLHNIQPHT